MQPAAGPVRLAGYLTVPENAPGVVLFAHGSGSSRHSAGNRYVATVLNQVGLGTLLLDLLTPEEEADRANVFDVELLGRRLAEVTSWLRAQPPAGQAAIGYFGASTGAAARFQAVAGRCCLRLSRQVQAGDHVVVGQLAEIGVELSDGIEAGRCLDANQLVGVGADPRLPGPAVRPGRPVPPGPRPGPWRSGTPPARWIRWRRRRRPLPRRARLAARAGGGCGSGRRGP